MPYTNDPENNPVDRIRLNVGDIWDDMEYLTDADYEYFLAAAGGNERRATMDAARAILFKLTRMTRERTGDIEVYGGDWFSNYMKALQLILKDPNISISLAVPYAGGISRSDMQANRCDPDNFRIGIGMYKIDRRDAILSGECGGCDGLYF
ncbi:hypothetical protein CNR37_00004 [Pseudomonas phage ventosus]|uniref:Uncharacterized protein n=1 Tax=Pseudomonas phage ventosus TaxID=2048980 RepID=A0A2H4P7R1_9CAUD|nr:hypothetical protein CNR37_00004 [Pseudomonas phage ventosus]